MVNPIKFYGIYYPNYTQYCTNYNFKKNNQNSQVLYPQRIERETSKINKDAQKKWFGILDFLKPKVRHLKCPNQSENIRNGKIEEEKLHIANPVTKDTKYNTEQLRSIGIPEREVKKYLTENGHVNDKGKKLLKEHRKPYKI